MKALKSDLAKSMLSDPKGKEQLRRYLANKGGAGTLVPSAASGETLEYRNKDGKTVRVNAKVVPKAA